MPARERFGRAAVAGLLLLAPVTVLQAVPVAAASAPPAAVCVDGTCTVTMDEPGEYDWRPPDYLLDGLAHFDMYGASGGDSGDVLGGRGGHTHTDFVMLDGTYRFVVGGRGSDCPDCGGTGQGGYNGGGDGGGSTGAGGGGGTDLRTTQGGYANRLLAAGGGGGAGSVSGADCVLGACGGIGGGEAGGAGGAGGGAGGNADGSAGSGDLGTGGDAVQGGGGGGGYYGGAGASGEDDALTAGGGGGSGGGRLGANGATLDSGVHRGDGKVVITYEASSAAVYSVALNAPPIVVELDSDVTFLARVTPAPTSGTVRFLSSRTADLATTTILCGAASIDAANGEASCTVTARTRGRTYVVAQYVAADSSSSEPSAVRQLNVEGIETSVALREPETNLVAGRATRFIADVLPARATGMVQFAVGGNEMGDPVPVKGAVATSPTTRLTVGRHTIRASYPGTSRYEPSTTERKVTVVAPDVALPRAVPEADGRLRGVRRTITRGDKLELTAKGYAPGARVVFGVYSERQQLAVATADPSGAARATVTVTSAIEYGKHTFVAAGSTSDGAPRYLTARSELVALGVLSPPTSRVEDPDVPGRTTDPGAPRIDLADTGFHGMGVGGLGLLTLLTGGFVLLATRRRTLPV